ncbi:MAG: response regulator [Candidatus Omnitrophota bacterium]
MNKPRILSVDDEPNFTDMLKQYFEPRGYQIDVTSKSEKGLEFLKTNKYDVALLDFKMSGLGGDEIMRQTKDEGNEIKIIFITAFSDSGKTKERLINEGAYAFMEKPIKSLKDLEDLINRAVKTDK